MVEKGKRVAFRLTEKEVEAVNKLKQKKFFDKSYAELFRYLLVKGLEAEKERKEG